MMPETAGADVMVLTWEKPPQAEPYEQWAACQADSAPPGTYAPNMDDGWKLRWKAKMRGLRKGDLRVEIRKSTGVRHAGSVQVLIIVGEDGTVCMSMNGAAEFSRDDWQQLFSAVAEARRAMVRFRSVHPAEGAQTS
jgi:hypothetical protein